MSLASKLKVGADPEFFLRNTRTDRYESAHDLIPGTKKDPFKVKGGAIQVDGTAVEFNIDPATTPDEFASNVDTVLRELRGIIPKHYKFVFKPDIDYDPEYFASLPEKTLELGCDPDYDARTGHQNKIPNPIGTMRTGSGHIHVGWTEKADVTSRSHQLDCREIVKSLQHSLGVYLHYFEEKGSRRPKMYGGPNAFRYKPYGVEYRTPSNVWLNYPETWPWIFLMVKNAIVCAEKGVHAAAPADLVYSSRSFARQFDKLRLVTDYAKEITGLFNGPSFPVIDPAKALDL